MSNFEEYGTDDFMQTDLNMRYGDDDANAGRASASSSESKPKILLMGLKKSGKSSIQKVVFNKMSPNEALFLESTNKIVKNDISNSSFVQFQIWDFPGQVNFFDPAFDAELIFSGCGALVFVIDAQDEDYDEALNKLHETVVKAYKINKKISFEVFIHKVDGLNDENKIEAQRDIQQHAADQLAQAKLEKEVHLSFYLTSIYDHSIFEAFSRVVQKLIPQLATLENLLDALNLVRNQVIGITKTCHILPHVTCVTIASILTDKDTTQTCTIEKSFLIDVVSKIYIATDSSPVDMQTYQLCSDMIDVVVDVSCIYGMKDGGDAAGLAYDERTQSIIRLSNQKILYLREVNKCLALVCLFREESFNKHGLIDYNFQWAKKAIAEVFKSK